MPDQKHYFIIVRTLRNQKFFHLGRQDISSKYRWSHHSFWSKSKSKAAFKNRSSEVKLLIIDELSMVPSDLWTDIDSRLGDIFMMIPEIPFAGLSVMNASDLLQLPPSYFLNFLIRIV